MDLSQAYTAPACNIWALGFLCLNDACFFLVIGACEVSIFMTRLALEFLGWTLETFNVI